MAGRPVTGTSAVYSPKERSLRFLGAISLASILRAVRTSCTKVVLNPEGRPRIEMRAGIFGKNWNEIACQVNLLPKSSVRSGTLVDDLHDTPATDVWVGAVRGQTWADHERSIHDGFLLLE